MVVSGELFTTVPVTVRLLIQLSLHQYTKLDRYTRLTADSVVVRDRADRVTSGWQNYQPISIGSFESYQQVEILTTRDLQELPLVTEKSKVRLILDSGLIHVELMAQAEEDGWLHDQIIVTNLSSNQRLMATVVGPETVEVTLE